MAASYINFYVANKAVLVPQFASSVDATTITTRDAANTTTTSDTPTTLAETDQRALDTLRPLFPGRTVVGVPSREVLLGGGNIHCQTQQVPSL